MSDADPLAVAGAIDLVRRRQVVRRDAVSVRQTPGGWVSVQAGKVARTPSEGATRVYWLCQGPAIGAAEIQGAAAALRELGATEAFIWLAPWRWNDAVEERLQESGATRWPFVEYLALACGAREVTCGSRGGVTARALAPGEAAAVLEALQPWDGGEGVRAGNKMIQSGTAEMHAAFLDGRPIASAFVSIDGGTAYLGAAWTDPAFRKRGAQTALIGSRARAAAERGAGWCIAETNTVVDTSLRNLKRCGLAEVIRWRVYRWVVREAG